MALIGEETQVTELSPMMQQYMQVKEQHKDHILFFRLGDFYEMFFDDALLVSKELELTLTGRDCGLPERAPMCGVPYHSCDAYIARLIKKGYKVAICEQMEDPKSAKGLVKRDVIRVITPGTLIETNMLEEGVNNFIASIYLEGESYGVAVADISTGEIHLTQFEDPQDETIKNEISRFAPSEIVFNTAFLSKNHIASFIKERLSCCAECLDDSAYAVEEAKARVLSHFGEETLQNLSLEEKPLAVCAAGGLLSYLYDTQKTGVERLSTIDLYSETQYMRLDITARRNLELTETMRSKEKRGSLLWVIDKTKTAMGKRLLRQYLEQPLVNPAHIDKRLNAVEELFENPILRDDIIGQLFGIYDLERLMTKIVFGNATPRELKSLEMTIHRLPALKERLCGVNSRYLQEIYQEIDPLEDICDLISRAIFDEPPITLKDGWVIKDGYQEELDRLRSLVTHSKEYLAAIETQEREKTGIKNLKISYNKVFGYYIEVTKSYLSLVPETYIRKQTLANCERYITQELKDLEDQILSANESILSLEARIFEDVRSAVASQLHRIQTTANAVARLDVFASLAFVAQENNYTRPRVNLSGRISITDGRHPVVESILTDQPFVSNDTQLDLAENRIAIITGPNMAGKSTYMRQTALIVLLAQIGSFVPAAQAEIGVVDGIYTRVGASDDLASGQSTFMVEMNEVAQILKGATSRSLLILDEIGRGTSTFDGMSIARAVIEYIADPKKLGAKTLFATHYHELTDLESLIPCVKNYNIAVKKRGDDITFLRKIIRGGADDSYGIEVSKLAGIPEWIIKRAHEILEELEAGKAAPAPKVRGKKRREAPLEDQQVMLPGAKISPVEELLKQTDLNTMSPIEALNKLYQLKALVQ